MTKTIIFFISLMTVVNGLLRIPVHRLHKNGKLGIHAGHHPIKTNYPVNKNLTLDGGYFINITVGTPPQPVSVFIDVSSADLLVIGYTADAFDGGSYIFNSAFSNTFKNIRAIPNQDQVIGEDVVGLSQDFRIPKTRFIIQNNNDPFDPMYYGQLGLAFPSLSKIGGLPPWPNVINQSLINPSVFTLSFSPNSTEQPNTISLPEVGSITFGGFDDQNCGPLIAYQQLSSATYYQFSMSFSFGSYSTHKTYQAILDNNLAYILAENTDAILGPKAVLDHIADLAGAVYYMGDTYANSFYNISCDAKVPPLVFTIGSRQYSIENLIGMNNLVQGCILNLFPSDNQGFGASWVLGPLFMEKYCTVYDMANQRVGFALSKNYPSYV